MKKNTRFVIAFVIFAMIQFACSKSDTKECDAQNYGTITANFTTTVTGFYFAVAIYSGNTFIRNKSLPAGKLSDTLHIAPGTYNIKLLLVTSNNLAFKTTDKNPVITKCSEETLAAGF
jgi:hypothetical protein